MHDPNAQLQTSENNCLALDHEGNQCVEKAGHVDEKGQVIHRVELDDTSFRLWVDDKKEATNG